MEKHSDRKTGTRVNAQVVQIKVCSNHSSLKKGGAQKGDFLIRKREKSAHKYLNNKRV